MSKPIQIVVAVRIMWTLIVVGGLIIAIPAAIGIVASEGLTLLDLFPLAIAVVFIALLAFLIGAVSAGRNWARILYSTLACVAILAVCVSLVRSTGLTLLTGGLRVFVIAIYGLVLYLLFHPASNQWFKRPTPSAL